MSANYLPLADVALINPSEPALSETAPFVPMDAVHFGKREVQYTEPRGSRSGARARAGDVLFARITSCLQNGKVALVQDGIDRCGGSTEFIVVRAGDALVPEYLYYWITSASVRDTAASMMTGATGRQRLNAADLGAIEIPVPDVDEQRRIVGLLDKATQHIADLEFAYAQTLCKFDDLRASALRSVLVGNVPTEIRELDDVASVEYGERVVRARDGGTIYPVYGGGGATFSIDRYNREDCYIVSRFGMSETCVRHVEGKFFLNDSGLSVRTSNASVVCQEYLDRFLLANQDLIFALSTGTAQKNLDVPSLRKFPIPVPTMAHQRQLVSAYDEVEKLAKRGDALTRQRLDHVRDLRQSVLEAAFRGEL